jgi:8-oxo-dGTP diphosphatase
MAGKTVHAAGGIVVRNGSRPLIAVVQRAKDELWVLPRGKLKSNESALAGARREVVEETGHRVRVREFLGAITYRARGRPKVVQFWRMQAEVKASRELMEDIVAVEWLPARRGRTTAELSARKIIPTQCRASPAASETPTAAPDAHVSQGKAAPARRENARPQITLAPRHRIASSGAQDIRTFGGARWPPTILQRVLGRISP